MGDTVTLTCYIPSTRSIFDVIIEKAHSVSNLKHHLWERKASTFPDTDPDDLQIWRVNISCDSSNATFDALQREYRPDIELLGGEELHPTQKIFEAFFNVPQEGRHIHVIVVAPVLWYRWENQKEPGTLSTKLLTKCVNLGGLAVELSHSNPYAQNLYPFEISFVESDDLRRTKILRRGIPLRELKTFDESPLIIRFPFSGRSVHVNLKFLNVPVEIILGHDTGTWHMLLDGTKKKYPKLEEAENEIYYVDAKKNIIENDFTFNNYLKNAPLNDQDEICLTFFVRIKGKRAYIEWDAKDVIREILHQQYANITFLPEFDIEDALENEVEITDDDKRTFVTALNEITKAFHYFVTSNEATARNYINPFMIKAVAIVQRKHPSARLAVEVDFDGSRGFGRLDYVIFLLAFAVLVTEAKMTEVNKGITQNLVQLHSAAENIRKRKRKESHHPTDYLANVYGIVTTGLEWRFIRWSDTLESPKVVISKPYRCTFNGEGMEDAEKVLSIIIRIIHSQAIFVESQIGSSEGIYEVAMKKDNVLRPS